MRDHLPGAFTPFNDAAGLRQAAPVTPLTTDVIDHLTLVTRRLDEVLDMLAALNCRLFGTSGPGGPAGAVDPVSISCVAEEIDCRLGELQGVVAGLEAQAKVLAGRL